MVKLSLGNLTKLLFFYLEMSIFVLFGCMSFQRLKPLIILTKFLVKKKAIKLDNLKNHDL